MPEPTPAPVRVRAYAPADVSATLAVFIAAVTVTAARDYAPERIAAWARPGARRLGDWDRSMLARASLVATIGGEIVGFSDVNGDGYIDMLFVAPAHGRRGVASALLAAVHERAYALGATRLWANVSITARPFFAVHGFSVEAEQHPMIGGVELTNFRMSRPLPSSAVPLP